MWCCCARLVGIDKEVEQIDDDLRLLQQQLARLRELEQLAERVKALRHQITDLQSRSKTPTHDPSEGYDRRGRHCLQDHLVVTGLLGQQREERMVRGWAAVLAHHVGVGVDGWVSMRFVST